MQVPRALPPPRPPGGEGGARGVALKAGAARHRRRRLHRGPHAERGARPLPDASRPHVAMHPRGHHRGRRERSGRVSRRGRVPAARQARRRGRRRAAARDPHLRPKLTISAVDDTGTSVTFACPRPPPFAACSTSTADRMPASRTGWQRRRRHPRRARAPPAAAAFAKMRRGAAALREAVRLRRVLRTDVRRRGTTEDRLGGHLPRQNRAAVGGSEVEGGRPRRGGRDGGGGEGRGRARGGDGGVDVGGERTGRRR